MYADIYHSRLSYVVVNERAKWSGYIMCAIHWEFGSHFTDSVSYVHAIYSHGAEGALHTLSGL